MASEFALHLKDHVYISTISDLLRMLKIDVQPGLYKFTSFQEGYVFAKEDYTPNTQDLVYLFNTRNGDRGLGGTYHDGESKDVDCLRLFNDYIKQYLEDDILKQFWDHYTDSDGQEFFCEDSDDEVYYSYSEDSEGEEVLKRTHSKYPLDEPIYKRPLRSLPSYHNIPVLFYLNTKPTDLSKITLEFKAKIDKDIAIWTVKYGLDDVGFAVKNTPFHNMVGDQAGVGISDHAQAFGNFSVQYGMDKYEEIIFIDYDCKFKPCNCDVRYEGARSYKKTKVITK